MDKNDDWQPIDASAQTNAVADTPTAPQGDDWQPIHPSLTTEPDTGIVASAEDAGKSFSGALARGLAHQAVDPYYVLKQGGQFAAQSVTRPIGAAYDYISDKTGLPPMSEGVARWMTNPIYDHDSESEKANNIIAEQGIPAIVKSSTGADMDYQPKTNIGRYAKAVGDNALFAPAMGIERTIASGIGGQGAEDIASKYTSNPDYLNAAKTLGNMGGGASPEIRDGLANAGYDASDSLAASKTANDAAKMQKFQDSIDKTTDTHSSISDDFFKSIDASNKYYDFAKENGEGLNPKAPQVREYLGKVIADIEGSVTPHEAAPSVAALKSIYDNLPDDGTVPANDLLEIRKYTNKQINPKRMNGKDSVYSGLNSAVDTGLDAASTMRPKFGQALDIADHAWINTVQEPFLKNPVLNKIWTPEDAYNMRQYRDGTLDEIPDETRQRADNMVSKVKDIATYNAIRRTLPEDIGAQFDEDVKNNILAKNGLLQKVGNAVGNLIVRGKYAVPRAANNLLSDNITPAQRNILKAIDLQNTYKSVADKRTALDTNYNEIKDTPHPNFSMVDQQRALPAPEEQRLLPAPEKPMVTSWDGVARPMSDEEYTSAALAKENLDQWPEALKNNTLNQKPISPEFQAMRNVPIKQFENSQSSPIPRTEYNQAQIDRLMNNSAWDNLDAGNKAKISQQIEQAWNAHQTPVADMINQAKKQAANIANITGKSPDTTMSAAFDKASGAATDTLNNIAKGHARGGRINTTPSEAQKRAGNYKKGHTTFQGLDITIENPRGSKREGMDRDGKKWSVRMPDHYGYLKRTTGADNEHIDCYLGSADKSKRVYIIDQKHLHNGRFDEHKVFLGYPTKTDAVKSYKLAFSDGKGAQRISKVTRMSIPEFKEWIKSNNTKKPVKK